MKNALFTTITALCLSAAVHAQSTVDSIESKYKLLPMPEALTTEKIFPVIGNYQLSGNANGTVTITLDSASKGIVWINGLPEGRMKAYLRQSPSTYRIVPQTTDLGKRIPEGTLVYSPDTRTLNVSLGAPYNDANPTAIFSNVSSATASAASPETEITVKSKSVAHHTKTKTKEKAHPIFYTGTKADENITTSASPVQQ